MKRSIHSTKNTALTRAPEKKTKNLETAAGINVPALYTSGLECLVQARRNWLDVAAQCHASSLQIYRQVFQFLPPGMFLLRFAEQAFAGYIEIQKRALDMVMEQTEIATNLAEAVQDGMQLMDTALLSAAEDSMEHAMDIVIGPSANLPKKKQAVHAETVSGPSKKLPKEKQEVNAMDTAIGAFETLPKKRRIHVMPSGKAAAQAA